MLVSAPSFQLCFNFNRLHGSVGKALRTANQGRVTANSHPHFKPFTILTYHSYLGKTDQTPKICWTVKEDKILQNKSILSVLNCPPFEV
jgi:hypothetical protein